STNYLMALFRKKHSRPMVWVDLSLRFPFLARHESRTQKSRHVVRDLIRVSALQIRQHDHRQPVTDIARNIRVEALPSALVFNHPMPVDVANKPVETVAVRVGLAI